MQPIILNEAFSAPRTASPVFIGVTDSVLDFDGYGHPARTPLPFIGVVGWPKFEYAF